MAEQPNKTARKRGRKFPFKVRFVAEREEINRLISHQLTSVTDMIYKITRTQLPGDLDDDTIDEVVQKCNIHLWRVSLPRYNAWRRPVVKVSTFLHKCITNFVLAEKRSIMRLRKQYAINRPILMKGLGEQQDEDRLLDRRIERVAHDILEHPEKYMTTSQVLVFKAVTRRPGVMMKHLAEILNYRRPSSLSMIKRRIRERIKEIAIEDLDIDSLDKEKHHGELEH